MNTDSLPRRESIVQHVKNKRIHHLQLLLRKRAFNQGLLDKALHIATRTGQVEAARLLIEYGANLRSLNSKGAPVLLGAVLGDHVDIITLLVICHYDLNFAIGNSIDTGIGVPLHIAIWKQNIQMIRVLVSAGVALETRDQDGNTALLVSMYVKNVEITEFLLKSGCDSDAQDRHGNTIVHIAIAVKCQELLTLALKYAQSDIPNDDGDTPFMLAIRYDLSEMIDIILEKCDIDAQITNSEGSNAIHYACAYSSCDVMQKLIDLGVDFTVKDRYGNTPLLTAGILGHQSHIESLLPLINSRCLTAIGYMKRNLIHWAIVHSMETVFKFAIDSHCFDLNLKDKNGESALILAIHGHKLKMVQTLVDAGAEVAPSDYDDYCPIHRAIDTGNTEIVRLLINNGANLHSVNKYIENSLAMSVRCGHEKITELILKSASDTDLPLLLKQKDMERCSCIHIAVAKGYLHILKLLLPYYEANSINMFESMNRCFETPLAMAGRFFNGDVIQLLLHNGSNSNVLDRHSCSPLYQSVLHKHEEAFKALLAHGADPNITVNETTILIEASKAGLLTFVSILIDKKANLNALDKYGRTPLMWAAQRGHTDVVQLLLKNKADPLTVDGSGDSALTIAAFAGNTDILTILIPISDLNHTEKEESMNSLLLALSQGHVESAQILLKANCEIDCIAANGNNGLLTACAIGNNETVIQDIILSGQKLDINYKGELKRTALHWVVSNPKSLQLLLSLSPNLDILDENGASPILLAIAHGVQDSAVMLIQAGCSIKMRHSDGRQPIHHAAIYGADTVLQLLLQSGVLPDSLTRDGRTPLLLACIEGRRKCVKLLIKYGANVNRLFFNAITPLSATMNEKHYRIADALLSAGADPDLIGSKKHRPLVNCVLNNDIVGVEHLLMWGSNMDATSNWMSHPIVVAAMNQRWNILRLLMSATNNVNVIKHILKNGALLYFVNDNRVMYELNQFAKQPVGLVKLCAKVIRDRIRRPLITNISKMSAPIKIKQILSKGYRF